MKKLKLGLIREGKVPSDRRVPLSPAQCKEVIRQFDVEVQVQSSKIRCFSDSEYQQQQIPVKENIDDCDILMGVKEVPVNELIPDKTYLFFSHTIKEQPYNRKLLQTVLERNITLIDYECITDALEKRVIGFGRYAGIVGCYNGFLAYGKRTGRYDLKSAHLCADRRELDEELKKVDLPAVKIVLTGGGRVGGGALEVISTIGIRRITPEELLKEDFNEPVYAQLDIEDYNRTKDGSPFTKSEFYNHPERFEKDFFKFARVAEIYIAGHYWDPQAPPIITAEDVKSPEFRIKVIADISCDVGGPIAPTIRPSTIEAPLYGYDRVTGRETGFTAENSITVMAVDNLPCELPKDASEDFGNELINNVLPYLLQEDSDGRIAGATIAKSGELTESYKYLTKYVQGDGQAMKIA